MRSAQAVDFAMKRNRKWLIAGMFDDFAKCPRCGASWPMDSVISWNWCPECRLPVRGFESDAFPQSFRNGEPSLASVLRLWDIDDDDLVIVCPIDEDYQPFSHDNLCAYHMHVKGMRNKLDLQRITVCAARHDWSGFFNPTYELLFYVRNANLHELYVGKDYDLCMDITSVPKPKRKGKK